MLCCWVLCRATHTQLVVGYTYKHWCKPHTITCLRNLMRQTLTSFQATCLHPIICELFNDIAPELRHLAVAAARTRKLLSQEHDIHGSIGSRIRIVDECPNVKPEPRVEVRQAPAPRLSTNKNCWLTNVCQPEATRTLTSGSLSELSLAFESAGC